MSKRTEYEDEFLADLRDSPAWAYFVNSVAAPLIAARENTALKSCVNADAVVGTYAVGMRDGMLDLLLAVYGDHDSIPETIKNLRRKAM